MDRYTAEDAAWINKQLGRPAVRAGDPVSPLETPERSAPWLRALSQQVWNRYKELASWHPFVSNVTIGDDIDPHGKQFEQQQPARDVSLYSQGPAAVLSGFWTPSDFSAPSLPADISFTTSAAITPTQLLVIATIDHEQRSDFRAFDVVNGEPHAPEGEGNADPLFARLLAEGLVRSAELGIFSGAGSNTDPLTGIVSQAGIRTQPATGSFVDETQKALQTLRNARRFPNVVFVSTALYSAIMRVKDSTGRYIFDPRFPASIDGVPIRQTTGLDGTNAGTAIVMDGRMLLAIYRRSPNGLLVSCDYSPDVRFSFDQYRYRVGLRMQTALVPGAGPDSTVAITGLPTA